MVDKEDKKKMEGWDKLKKLKWRKGKIMINHTLNT